MQWVAISGSWRHTNDQLEHDVRSAVADVINAGDGIVSGGALGVDYFATDEALKHNPDASRIKIILPTPFNVFQAHFFKRANENVITHDQARMLIDQLETVRRRNPNALIEMAFDVCTPETYYARNQAVIDTADRLLAFQVNKSEGVMDAILKAQARQMPVIHKEYTI